MTNLVEKRILVMEENEELLTIVEARLHARKYVVDSARDLDQASKALAQNPPDMVLVGSEIWKTYGRELCQRIRSQLGSSTTPIILMAEEEETASLIMILDSGLDDFILKPFSTFELQLRVAINFHRNEERIQANPLTKLPGNLAIDNEIRRRIESKETFSVCYIDIDNFKAFNDAYGFDRGDDVLLQTANIITRAANSVGTKEKIFVGNIGGDDFLVILSMKFDHVFAKECIHDFDRIIPTYYKDEDVQRGGIMIKNRKGRMAKIPMMSLSIASVTNENRRLESPAQIAQIAAEVKNFLKTQQGSNFLRDRRDHPLRDLELAVKVLADNEKSGESEKEPLGQILLSAGLITEQQLAEALEHHFRTGQRLGQVLVNMNLCRSEDVGRMLERKLGIRYISLTERKLSPGLARLFTEEYVRTHRVSPIRVKDKKLYLAMIDPFDIKTVDYVERITGYKVVPCLALEDEFERFLENNFTRSPAEGSRQ